MSQDVRFTCEKCGGTEMEVTSERRDGTIDGHCLGCGQEFSGFYVPITEPNEHLIPS